MAYAVQVEGLRKAYGRVQAVQEISLAVEEGEVFGVVGPNGAGKTTLLECLEGLRRPDEGRVRVLDLDPWRDGYALRNQIGVQLQEAGLPGRLRVLEALELFAAFYPRRKDPRALLERLGLWEKRGGFVGQLSGGQKGRLFLALALVNDPRLLFLDEPTTALDPQARRSIWELVAELRKEGRTILLTTHSMEEAERLCDRVAILDHGRVLALDTPLNLIRSLGGEVRVAFDLPRGLDPGLEAGLRALPGVVRVEVLPDRATVYGREEGLLGALVGFLEARGIPFANLRTERPTLEDVYLALTGRAIRG